MRAKRPATVLIVALLLLLSYRSSDAATLGLAWDPPTDGITTGYVVRYGTTPGTYTQSINVGMVTSYSITTLADGVTYYFAVQAYSAGGQLGPLSSEVSGATRTTAPLNLAAAASGSSATLTWQAPSGTVTGYRVEVGTTSGQSNVATIDTGVATTYVINSLPAGTYYLRVRSVNAGGVSAPSNEVTVSLTASPVLPPTNLSGVGRSGQYIDLSWQAAGGSVSGYRIEVGTAAGQSNVTTVNTGMVTSYSLSGFAAGTYYVRVRSVNGTTVSAPSNEVTVTLAAATATPPTALAVTVRNNQFADLTWQPPSGAVTGYRVEVGSGPGQSNVATATIGAVTSYTVGGLTAGTYYIRVRSVNGTAVSGPSNEVTATIALSSSGAPTNLVASVRNSTYIDLTWSAPTGTTVSGYRVEAGTSPGGVQMGTDTTASTSYSISFPAGTYYIRVRALVNGSYSAASNEVVVTTGATTTPPSGLVANVRNNQFVDLLWQAAGGTVTGYRVEVGTASGLSNVTTADLGAVTTYTVIGLTPGTYYFRVRTVNGTAVTGPSNEVEATISTDGPQPPRNLAASTREGQVLELAWEPPATPVQGFRVDVGNASGQSNVRSTTVNGTVTNFTVNDLRGGPYYVRVHSVQGTVVSTPSNEVQALLAPSAPLNLSGNVRGRRSADLSWQAPTTGAASYSIDIGTAPGLTNVRSINTDARRYTISDLPNGTYYFRVRGMNAAGLGTPSSEVRLAISRSSVSPLAPSNLTASVRDGNLIDLAWTPEDTDVQYYRVEVGTAPAQTDVSSFTTGVTTSFTIGELPARTYYIRVRSANDLGVSEPTNEVVINGVGGNGAPRRLSGTANAGGVVRLMWDPPEDATGLTSYVVEAGAGPGRSDLGIVPTHGHSFTAGPVPSGTYFVRVRAMTASGPGSASNEIVLHVGEQQECTAAPAAPRLSANVEGNLLELSWSPGVGDAPTGYVLDVGTTPGRTDIASLPLGADVTTLTTQVQDGTYALRLTAVNSCGASTWGTDTTLTIGGPAIELPGAPSALMEQVTGRSATLTWAPATSGGEATSYTVEVLSPTDQVILSMNTGNVATTFTHGDVPPGQYTVRVRGSNARGAGAPSNAVVVIVQ